MTAEETPADRLRAAADRIRTHFTRGHLRDDDGNLCALGAILNVTAPETTLFAPGTGVSGVMTLFARDGNGWDATSALHAHLVANGDDIGLPYSLRAPGYAVAAIEHWNDVVAEDGWDAAAAMEKAAARWEETGHAEAR